MPHNLAWHEWEMRTRVQRAHREVEQIRRSRMAGDASSANLHRFLGGVLTKLQSFAGSAITRTPESVKGAMAAAV